MLAYRAVMLAGLLTCGSTVHAQAVTAPATKAAVGPFDVQIVKRAEALLDSPGHWNRADSGSCPRTDTAYTVRCAINRAVKEAAGLPWKAGAGTATTATSAARTACAMDVSPEHPGGSCGTLWDELPVFILSSEKAIASGVWRADAKPIEIWAGTMSDAEYPVDYERYHGVDAVKDRKSNDQLIDFNNDSTTTFGDVQTYFRALEARVLKQGAADLDENFEDVEIEIYADGTGVMRTYNGWFAVSDYTRRGSSIQFKVDTLQQVAPNALDREILVRASKLISSDAVWNRADNRKCPAGATTWSIYCAVEQAQREVAGGFHHRRPAGELVRVVVEERTVNKKYHHRMMDYNNDPATTLADVRAVFAEAIARIK
ncbi:MAG TPA: hypothetical protein VN613_12940 [Gemmatimonadaceae bacterium]|nr:hypothetical protein [Gemmatimonadaceae bacterium]